MLGALRLVAMIGERGEGRGANCEERNPIMKMAIRESFFGIQSTKRGCTRGPKHFATREVLLGMAQQLAQMVL